MSEVYVVIYHGNDGKKSARVFSSRIDATRAFMKRGAVEILIGEYEDPSLAKAAQLDQIIKVYIENGWSDPTMQAVDDAFKKYQEGK